VKNKGKDDGSKTKEKTVVEGLKISGFVCLFQKILSRSCPASFCLFPANMKLCHIFP